jgi:MFS family permease
VAVAALIGVGVSNAVLDVAGFTLVQRMAPNAARVAVLGLIDGVANAGPALGGLVAPALVAGIGIQGALIASGMILPFAAFLAWSRLQRLDEGGPAAVHRLELLRGQPLFTPLSLATIEHLASRLVPIHAEAGTWLMREGDPGDRYLLIDAGECELSRFGQIIGTLGPGDGVGEIALLHDVPRTASLRATTPIEAFSLDRDAFLEAVTGHPVSHAAARTVADARLAADRERDV